MGKSRGLAVRVIKWAFGYLIAVATAALAYLIAVAAMMVSLAPRDIWASSDLNVRRVLIAAVVGWIIVATATLFLMFLPWCAAVWIISRTQKY
ncbi:MAG TPA: hypothetical protein VGR70_12475, partial [Stellaceae bacterium]|nr:hypothetical protein [Stellaceae bacterium]